jgi:hypothetical protein
MPSTNILNSSSSRHSGLSGYYPFGMQMQGREFASGMGYRWGFGSQECDNDLSGRGNSYTAEFWQYESRLGRRWNVDPVDQVFLSNYSVNGCNPILFNDPRGAKFGKGKEHANEYRAETEKRRDESVDRQNSIQNKLNNRISRKQGKNENYNVETDRKAKNYIGKIQNEQNLQNGLAEVFCEIEALEKSDWVYDIELINDPNWKTDFIGGEVTFNLQTNHIEVKLNVNWNRLKTISHELKHAYQFEEGKIGFKNGIGYFVDLKDEEEAFKRNQLFGFYQGDEITTWWVIGQGYKPGSHSQTTSTSSDNSHSYGYWEMYYYSEGTYGTKINDLIIVNLSNWASIYMRGVQSCNTHK